MEGDWLNLCSDHAPFCTLVMSDPWSHKVGSLEMLSTKVCHWLKVFSVNWRALPFLSLDWGVYLGLGCSTPKPWLWVLIFSFQQSKIFSLYQGGCTCHTLPDHILLLHLTLLHSKPARGRDTHWNIMSAVYLYFLLQKSICPHWVILWMSLC